MGEIHILNFLAIEILEKGHLVTQIHTHTHTHTHAYLCKPSHSTLGKKIINIRRTQEKQALVSLEGRRNVKIGEASSTETCTWHQKTWGTRKW